MKIVDQVAQLMHVGMIAGSDDGQRSSRHAILIARFEFAPEVTGIATARQCVLVEAHGSLNGSGVFVQELDS